MPVLPLKDMMSIRPRIDFIVLLSSMGFVQGHPVYSWIKLIEKNENMTHTEHYSRNMEQKDLVLIYCSILSYEYTFKAE